MQNDQIEPCLSDFQNELPREQWHHEREVHRARVAPWTEDRVHRAGVAEKHPVFDFLFTYYPFRPAHLLRWTPGVNVLLVDAKRQELDWPEDFKVCDGGFYIPAGSFPNHRHDYLAWALRYLEATTTRPATFNCYGLHEWAMLYHESKPRHSQVPLRLSPQEIAQVIESLELRCSHYDAYRFFTPEAKPLNRLALSRHSTTENDQPGCIHVTMDLYKFAHKIAPWCPSDLMADTFILAADARLVDMRASPYDLRQYGLESIKIEEPNGRADYIAQQYALADRARPLRARLIGLYSYLFERLTKA
jgi:hypothetical protein